MIGAMSIRRLITIEYFIVKYTVRSGECGT